MLTWLLLTATPTEKALSDTIITHAQMMATDGSQFAAENAGLLAHAEIVCTVLFTAELLAKVLALGLIRGREAYLQSPWNVLDAVVVVSSLIPYIFMYDNASGAGLRTFRLLRPLRTISRYPGLKRLVITIFMAIPQLQMVVITICMYFLLFSICATQLWQGNLMQRCHPRVGARCVGDSVELCKAEYEFAGDSAEFCDMRSTGNGNLVDGNDCADIQSCERHHTNPFWGVISYDNVGRSAIVVLHLLTITGWQEIMHITQDTGGQACFLFFVVCVVFGGFFLLHLFVAALKNSYEIALHVNEAGESVFSAIDEDESGFLDKKELEHVFHAKGITVTTAELNTAFKIMDRGRDNKILLEEFTRWLRSTDVLALQLRNKLDLGLKNRSELDAELHRELHLIATADDLGWVEAQARKELRSLGLGMDWAGVFQHYDRDGSGSIDLNELQQLLRKDANLRVDAVPDHMITDIFEIIDTDGDGNITCEEFCHWLADDSTTHLSSDDPGLQDGVEEEKPGDESEETLPAWRVKLCAFVEHRAFVGGVMTLIIISTGVLACDHFGLSETTEIRLNMVNQVLLLFFTIEIVLKLVAYSPQKFKADHWNLLDLAIVISNILELLFESLEGFRVLRVVRVLRLLRLIRYVPSLKATFEVLIKALGGLAHVGALTGIFLSIFTILGMQLFAGTFQSEPKPRWHFDTFFVALGTTFQIMTFDNWNFVMYDAVRSSGNTAVIYFLVWLMIGALVLLNLLLVIILDVYSRTVDHSGESNVVTLGAASSEASKDSMAEDNLEFANPISDILQEMFEDENCDTGSPIEHKSQEGSAAKKIFEDENCDTGSPSEHKSQEGSAAKGKSCGIFPADSTFRVLCARTALSPRTDQVIMAVILVSCVTMALDHPDLEPNSTLAKVLLKCDVLFTLFFTAETAMKVIAFTFSAGSNAYMRSSWNQLDLMIVVISWVDMLATALDIGFLKTLRLLRVLRVLRMFNKLPGLKLLINSLVDSVKSLTNLFGLTLLIMLIFAIIGVDNFKGLLWKCNDMSRSVEGVKTCAGTFMNARGELTLRHWHNSKIHFDDVASAYWALFVVSTRNDWVLLAHRVIDGTAVDKQPVVEHQPLWIIYFAVFIVCTSYFFLNLFVGVIYDKYVVYKMAGLEMLSKGQKNWLDVMMSITLVRPQKRLLAQEGNLHRQVYDLVTNRWFDKTIGGCIIFNCVLMATSFYGEPEGWTFIQDRANDFFTLVFTAEAALKIFAFGWRPYFSIAWNRFDFLVVLASLLDILLRIQTVDTVSAAIFRVVRIARIIGRVARLLQIVGQSSTVLGVDQIIDTLMLALPQMAYVGLLLAIIVFIFAVLGMNLFGKVAHNGCLNKRTNFERVPTAMLTLFGLGTKDRITCTAEALMVTEPACSEADGTCGSPAVAKLYIVAFSLMIMFTTIEMFVNVILQKFHDISAAAALPVTLDNLHRFVDVWAKYDPGASGCISRDDLPALVEAMPRQLGIDTLSTSGDAIVEYDELRLPPLPNGDFCKMLLANTEAHDPMAQSSEVHRPADSTATDAGPECIPPVSGGAGQGTPTAQANPIDTFDGNSTPGGRMLNFYEVLYAMCERKAGKPVPASNQLITEAWIKLGLRMPSLAPAVLGQLKALRDLRKAETLGMFLSVDRALHEVDKQTGTHLWEEAHVIGMV
jgi:Ca2+-binding EF-hand superfamily protein